MAKTLTLEMVTPEKVALTQTADFVVLPAFEGEMGVLPGHEPYLVQLKEGEVLPGYRLPIEAVAVVIVSLTGHLGGFLSGVNGPG